MTTIEAGPSVEDTIAIINFGPDTFDAMPISVPSHVRDDNDLLPMKSSTSLSNIDCNSSGSETFVLTLDFRKTNVEGATISLGEPQTKADVTIDMTAKTFDKISAGELSGFRAFATGQLSFSGNLLKLK